MNEQNVTIVVSQYTPGQGEGWTVERCGPEFVAGYNEQRTLSRWTTRERAIAEGRKVADELGAPLAIY